MKTLRVGLMAVLLGVSAACSAGAGSDVATDEGAVGADADVLAGGGRFEVRKIESGQWVFNLKARNGAAVLHSERYESKANAEKGISSALKNLFDDARVVLDADGFFAIEAKNGQEVARSEKYATPSNRTRALGAIRALVAGHGEQDPEAPAQAAPALDLPFPEVLVVPAGEGLRIRLVDASGKLHLRMPGSKRLAPSELDEWFFAFEALTLLERDANGLPVSGSGTRDSVQIEKGAAGYYFHFVDFRRDAQGLWARRILMTSPKTDYATEGAALDAAKAAMQTLDQAPKG